MWGFLPLYFLAVGSVDPVEIVAQRVLWSVIFIAAVLAFAKRFGRLRIVMRNRRIVATRTG